MLKNGETFADTFGRAEVPLSADAGDCTRRGSCATSRSTLASARRSGSRDLQVTPLVINGLMYLTAGSTVYALAPETGRPAWTFESPGPVSKRGVAYWPGDGRTPARLYSGVREARMVALDAKTGAVVADFGERGYVHLKQSVRGDVDGPFMLDSPPVVYRDIVITGGSNGEGSPSTGLYGDIRGWDARSGKLLWSFHTVPRAGEPGDVWRSRQ